MKESNKQRSANRASKTLDIDVPETFGGYTPDSEAERGDFKRRSLTGAAWYIGALVLLLAVLI